MCVLSTLVFLGMKPTFHEIFASHEYSPELDSDSGGNRSIDSVSPSSSIPSFFHLYAMEQSLRFSVPRTSHPREKLVSPSRIMTLTRLGIIFAEKSTKDMN